MDDLKEEIKELSKDSILSKEYRNKKLITYLIRTIISAVIIYFLWDYDWIKWVLYIYIPLNLISLLSIFGWNFLLNKRLAKTNQKLDMLIESGDEEE
ncbi:hypothetical protein [Winogradskyella marincola]|uniref:2TM domain-containing protein n=1 Tax=Winogradskyella marincola TaxID=3037795 RepID=A0ABT6G232_9FLAO|nr:hypothetical protein [Winogradskyella sp. YYF002]MDG4716093.1 hypothetical protein [Winogradskyella sp. YYF002]